MSSSKQNPPSIIADHDNDEADVDYDGLLTDNRINLFTDDLQVDDVSSQQMLMEECEEENGAAGGHLQLIQECQVSSCWHFKNCVIYTFILLVIIIVAASVALVVIIVLVVWPYIHAADFSASTCTVTALRQSSVDYTCSCGKGCNSKYPCIHITVTLGTPAPSHNVTLFENEVSLNKECSFYPQCKTSRSENNITVKNYAKEYGTPGKSYSCLYNPHNHAEVIRTRRFQLQHVVHGLLWSSILLLAALGLLLGAALRRRRTGCVGL